MIQNAAEDHWLHYYAYLFADSLLQHNDLAQFLKGLMYFLYYIGNFSVTLCAACLVAKGPL